MMRTNLEGLEAEALKPEPSARSHLLERRIASLDIDQEVEAAWEQEADRREASLALDAVKEVTEVDSITRLRSTLAR